MKRFLLILLCVTPLAACETWDGWMNDMAVPSAVCLPVTAPADVASRTLANGDSPMDLRASLNLTVGKVECESKDGALHQSVTVRLSATKGPALKKDETLTVPFFGAVMAADGTASARKLYQSTLAFTDEDVQATDTVTLHFTLSAAQADGASLAVGFDKAGAQ